jgi:hypothetical protein
MTSNSNQTVFATLTSTYVAVKLASGLAVNTATLLFTGATNGSVITDILFRNTDASNARNLDFFIGPTTTAENNLVQVSVPANSGNNGSTAIASLAALAPAIFDLDLAGNRVITIESGVALYVINKTALTADMFVRLKTRGF